MRSSSFQQLQAQSTCNRCILLTSGGHFSPVLKLWLGQVAFIHIKWSHSRLRGTGCCGQTGTGTNEPESPQCYTVTAGNSSMSLPNHSIFYIASYRKSPWVRICTLRAKGEADTRSLLYKEPPPPAPNCNEWTPLCSFISPSSSQPLLKKTCFTAHENGLRASYLWILCSLSFLIQLMLAYHDF